MDRVVIVGMGLIGGSLGMALKRSKIKNMEIVGVDREREPVVRAQRRGAIDRWERPDSEVFRDASIVIVATPILAMAEVFKSIAPALPAGCVVTDVGSTKVQVLRWAEEFLPPNVSFVGGHPMAGKERPGIDGADPALFKGSTYCIVPSATAAPGAVETIVGLAQTIGSEPYFVEAEEHDLMVAGISHLPLILASALVSVTSRSPSWREMARLAASGYRDTSRLASSDLDLSTGITATNQAGIIRWLDGYIEVLKEYRGALVDDQDPKAMETRFTEAWDAREKWLNNQTVPNTDSKVMDEVPTSSENINSMFFGGVIARFRRRQQEADQREMQADKPRDDRNR